MNIECAHLVLVPSLNYLYQYILHRPTIKPLPLTAPDDSYTILVPRSFAIIPTGIFLTYH